MDDTFRIYVDQLRDGHDQTIKENIAPAFLDIKESALFFKKNVKVDGKAYLAGSDLILCLNAVAEALIPCTICNDLVPVDIRIKDFYFTQPLAEIKSAVFSFEDVLREAILIEVPQFAECNKGHCPHRGELAKYLEKEEKTNLSEEGYQPFSDFFKS